MTMELSQAALSTVSRFYLTFTVSDSATSNPRFDIGSQHFPITNAYSGSPVQTVVADWGEFSVIEEASDRSVSTGSITLFAEEYMASGSVAAIGRKKVLEWLRILPIRNTLATLYLWNAYEATQSAVWSGYVAGIDQVWTDEGGVPMVSLRLVSSPAALSATPISILVNETDFANSPKRSRGLMIPRLYGGLTDVLHNNGNAGSKAQFGFPMPGMRAIVTDDKSAADITLDLGRPDGTTAYSACSLPAATGICDANGAPYYGDLWIYDSGMGAYGMIDKDSITSINLTTGAFWAVLKLSPVAWFFVKPTLSGAGTASGLAASMNKPIDDDSTNYVETTTTHYVMEYETPSVSFPGEILSIHMGIDVLNASAGSRTIRFGFYEPFAPAWAGTTPKYVDKPISAGFNRQIVFTPVGMELKANDFTGAYIPGTGTQDAFNSGHFISRNATDTLEGPMRMRCEAVSANKDLLRIYGVTLIVQARYPSIPKKTRPYWFGPDYQKKIGWKNRMNQIDDLLHLGYRINDVAASEGERFRDSAVDEFVGTDFFVRGAFQKDDGSGTYTGSASSVIYYAHDIAHHLIRKLGGRTVNSTASTFGNFVDPRTWGVTKDMDLGLSFGPDVYDFAEAVRVLEERFPIRLYERNGTWLCIPDDMNPHSSRFFRSTTETVDIRLEDIVEGSFRCSQMAPEDMVNKVRLRYAHGYPDRDAAATYLYDNPLSQMYWGSSDEEIVDEPAIPQNNLESTAQQSAVEYAQWRGRRSARPRLIVDVALREKFFDLGRGHILQIYDLERSGIRCPAFRCGLLDYHYQSSASATNQADSITPAFIISTGSGEMYLGTSQQVDHYDFWVSVVAAYTTVASGWEYLNATGTWTAHSGVGNADALKSTGQQRVTFTRPSPWNWGKREILINSVLKGPCYWSRMKYTSGTATGTGSARTSYDPNWFGRLFEVKKESRIIGSISSDYPVRKFTLVEVM